MKDTLRDSFAGQLLHAISKGKILPYAEERPEFQIPEKYQKRPSEKKSRFGAGVAGVDQHQSDRSGDVGRRQSTNSIRRKPVPAENEEEEINGESQQRPDNDQRSSSDGTVIGEEDRENGQSQGGNACEKKGKKGDSNKEKEGEGKDDDNIIVGWYGDDDPENPLNWSFGKKCGVVSSIMLMTSSVYAGSSIWAPCIMDAMEYFHLGQVTITLGISLFVAGYGIGPLFLAPISEIPQIGRTIPYIITLTIFCVLQVPTALVENFAGFAILRFLAGFVGSPPLATGGASIQDMFTPYKVPYAMGLWGLSAGAAPAIAPVISSFAVEVKGWRWAFYIMLWLSGGSLALLLFFLPETSKNTILLRRARRLRKLTGNPKIKSQSEIDSEHMTPGEIVKMTLIRPISMTFTEPIVLAINLYIGLIYAILYSYFESFPIVYAEGYGWSLGVSTLPFLSLFVGAIISYAVYAVWNRLYFEPMYFKLHGRVKPEARLPMAMLAAFCYPICLFWFAWTSNRTSWVSPLIASGFFGLGLTWMFMPFLTYLPHAYPEYAASVLASNDFVRSMMGAGMPLASVPLFKNIGINWGNTMLGCLTVLFLPIPFILYKAGPWLRERSPKALHDKHIEDQEADERVIGAEP